MSVRDGRANALPSIGLAGAALRLMILASGSLVMASTQLVVGEAKVVLTVAGLAFVVLAAVDPDSHASLVAIAAGVGQWLALVDDTTSAGSVLLAVGVGVLHISTAAAAVAPPGARWSSSMVRRWSTRSVVALAATAITFSMVATLDGARLGAGAVLAGVALAAIGVGGVWLRRGSFR